MQKNETPESATGHKVKWIQVDLDAIAHNVCQLDGCFPEGAQLMAVVKANAVGHGAVLVARALVQHGVGHPR